MGGQPRPVCGGRECGRRTFHGGADGSVDATLSSNRTNSRDADPGARLANNTSTAGPGDGCTLIRGEGIFNTDYITTNRVTLQEMSS